MFHTLFIRYHQLLPYIRELGFLLIISRRAVAVCLSIRVIYMLINISVLHSTLGQIRSRTVRYILTEGNKELAFGISMVSII